MLSRANALMQWIASGVSEWCEKRRLDVNKYLRYSERGLNKKQEFIFARTKLMNRKPELGVLWLFLAVGLATPSFSIGGDDAPADKLPSPGSVVVDEAKQEVILSAKVQFPEGKPCINEFGQRIQAFAGCIACPCDCPGGIIADNRFPIYDPKPTVRFDMSKAPAPGTQVYVRIRAISSLPE